MSEPVTFDLFCPSCGGAVTLQMGDWGTLPLTDAPWECPYCHRAQRFAMSGRLLWVTKRERPTPIQ